jgi:prepilin-type N-terminal cleavage/methylation domain-containing protein/prepilin-type processing-associated H-X9-DG protein
MRRGFGLTELLAVLAIVVLLAAISLPAIQAIRGQARSVQCQNNLKQIWLGVANFESANGHLPSGVYPNFSLFVAILPFVDARAIYDSLDFNEWSSHPTNSAIVDTAPPYHRCPMDLESGSRGAVSDARTSYLASWGTAWLLGKENGTFSRANGNRPSFAMITDGLSNTVGLAEFANGTKSNRLRIVDGSYSGLSISQFDRLVINAQATTIDTEIGNRWHGNGLSSAYYTHYLPPGSKSARLKQGNLDHAAYSPSSNHSNRIHVAYADGAIAPCFYSIDRVLWVQLGDRADGGANPLEKRR